jgi:endoglucanase
MMVAILAISCSVAAVSVVTQTFGSEEAENPCAATHTLEFCVNAEVKESPTAGQLLVEVGRGTGADPQVLALNPSSTTLRGVNLSGGEFGEVPGTMGRDYIYPPNELLDDVRKKGFELVRLPFRWERVQPQLFGALSERDVEEIQRIVSHARSLGLVVVLDLHNYARRTVSGERRILGASDLPASALADFWERFGELFPDQEAVWFGLMNEPHGLTASAWWADAQFVVVHLRGRNVGNILLVPGTQWTGAWSWARSGNAREAQNFSDPLGKTIFEVHQYLDADSSGTSGDCSIGSASRIDDVIEWAERGHYRLFFGEIAAGSGQYCESEYRSLLDKVAGSDAVVGWAAWGGGPWWPEDYPFRLTFDDRRNPTRHDQYLARPAK